MRHHPRIGAGILEDAGLEDVREWILATTSAPTAPATRAGSGGRDPLEAKILAVADSYEAMTNDRCYRRSIGREGAVAELRATPARSSTRSWSRLSLRARARRAGGDERRLSRSPPDRRQATRQVALTRWS